ncbi:MAG: serine/threonine protein kinase [Planctomycetaceae bacterium]|nr:serine/threonine protein kinase [Planctomycetaceae bacterium]
MGVVLKAVDPALNRVIALKVLSPHLATSANARKRFLREARAAAAVCHENVVTIHAVREAARLPYLVMEFIGGVSLQERINSEGPLPVVEILRIGIQVAGGLAAAHAQGLVHRDVKPGNILLENGVQRVKITDFGLARAADDGGITHDGMMVGTPEYMSPEQARGEPVDHRTDLFSLGSVLHAMCTGKSPFRAETTTGIVHRVCNTDPCPLFERDAAIPGWLAAIVSRLHAKAQQDRIQSAVEVVELLGGHLAALQRGDDPALLNLGKESRMAGLWLPCTGVIALLAGAVAGSSVISQEPKASLQDWPARDPLPLKSDEATRRMSPPAIAPDVLSALAQPVTLNVPYAPPYKDAPTDKLSVQYAVKDICAQVGLSYHWSKSQRGSAPFHKRWVTPHFVNVPARDALGELLRPFQLTFAVDESGVFLKHVDDGANPRTPEGK